MANACPGIKVSNFTYFNNFILLIRIQPSPIQLEQDEPLLITVENVLPDINNHTYNGQKLKDYPVISSISQLDDILKDLTENLVLPDLEKKLKNLGKTSNDPQDNCDEVDCDDEVNANDPCCCEKQEISNSTTDDTSNLDCTKINCNDSVNSDNICCQENFTADEVAEVTKLILVCDHDGKTTQKIIAPELPPFEPPAGNDLTTCLVQPRYEPIVKDIKNIMTDLTQIQENNPIEFQDKIDENFDQALQALFNTKVKLSEINAQNTQDEQNIFFDNNLGKNTQKITKTLTKFETYLGIPLATFNNTLEIHLTILDHKIQVTNLHTLTDRKDLSIDRELVPNGIYTIVFRTNGFNHSLYLLDETTGQLFSNSITVSKNLGVYNIGIDPQLRKNFCGRILDVQIYQDNYTSIKTLIKQNYLYKLPPGVLAFYDWHVLRVDRNVVYPLPEIYYPLKMYGNNTNIYQLDTDSSYSSTYTPLKHGYLANFFCNRMIEGNPLTINFWFKIEDYDYIYNNKGFVDYRTIIEDDINGTSLEYDLYESNFKITLNNYQEEFFYRLLENNWYYLSFKIDPGNNTDQSNPRCIFSLRSIDSENHDDYFYKEIPLQEGYKFILMTILARYNQDIKNYDSFFDVKLGNLSIFKYITTESEDYLNFSNNKNVYINLGM